MDDIEKTLTEFFQDYADALLARDSPGIAEMYAVPSLVLFPGNSIAVSDKSQTEQFFASSWSQYEGVNEAHSRIGVMARSDASVWADVVWSYDGEARERFCYQLIAAPDGYRIAVLTPLPLDPGVAGAASGVAHELG